MGKSRKIDPRELIPETRPKRRFEQGPIPPAPLLGCTQLDLAMAGVSGVGAFVKFELPTSRVKPRGIVFVYDISLDHTDAGTTLNFIGLSRQAPEDASPITIFQHQHSPGIALPQVVTMATPLPFPLGGDAIYNYTPLLSLGFSALGTPGATAFAALNWIFYEWDAALGRGAMPALGGIGAALAGTYKRFDVSE